MEHLFALPKVFVVGVVDILGIGGGGIFVLQ